MTVINHNLPALNTYRQMVNNNFHQSKALEKLSSGLRINRAGDDAAGLAISEKMRAQIRGLDQASRNSQDGISMIQTAEGALQETHDILQRMRELATQAANDTNVAVDRSEIQKEINQLSSEINRVGNTTEFNTQKLLKGDGKSNLSATGKVVDNVLVSGADEIKTQEKMTFQIRSGLSGGQVSGSGVSTFTFTFGQSGPTVTIGLTSSGANGVGNLTAYNVTQSGATVNVSGVNGGTTSGTSGDVASAVKAAMEAIINANSALKDQWKVSVAGDTITVEAVAGGDFDGQAGSGTGFGAASPFTISGNQLQSGYTQAATNAYKEFSGFNTVSGVNVSTLVGKGFTVNGQQIEFYNADNGSYTGEGIGVNLSTVIAQSGSGADIAKAIATQAGTKLSGVMISASGQDLKITAKDAGAAGNAISFKDGGTSDAFKATFQVGANKNQSFSIDINDMRSKALGVTTDTLTTGFNSSKQVTDGTSSTTKEFSLDVSTYSGATNAIQVINNAIEKVSAERSKLGAFQNRLEHTINNLGTSAENLTAAESRIRDVDMAKEMMNMTKRNILSQASQAMLAQANQQPQGVLQLLR